MQVIHVLESDIGIFVENLKFNGYYKGRRGQGGREGTKPISKFCLGVDKNVIPGMSIISLTNRIKQITTKTKRD